ncbi:MAG TPA: hypothetical protein VGB24_11350 [Longimicrobium sp.]|jgi:hypothetical protein|uniref:hypothetical protein n=1 Tax=Longimicrobium sp. TaxID=2029185 RepID=UPI002EDB478B
MLRPGLALVFALLLATCRGDEPRGSDQATEPAPDVVEKEYVPPQLTPAESAAAVANTKAEGEAMTRKVMGPEYTAPTEPFVDTPEKQYASCMIQARSLEEPVKSTVLNACERFRNPPR